MDPSPLPEQTPTSFNEKVEASLPPGVNASDEADNSQTAAEYVRALLLYSHYEIWLTPVAGTLGVN